MVCFLSAFLHILFVRLDRYDREQPAVPFQFARYNQILLASKLDILGSQFLNIESCHWTTWQTHNRVNFDQIQ